jgi:hypothetical protein
MNPANHHWVLGTVFSLLPLFSNGQCSEMGSYSGSIFSNDPSTGNFPFINPGNILSTDNNRASATALITLLSGSTNSLRVSGFGFAIPASAGICGIKVELEKSATGTNLFAWVNDESVRLVKAGNITGANKASAGKWNSVEAYSTYGGMADQWDATWTPAEINDQGFGIAFSAHITGLISLLPSARVDHVKVTVYYNLVLPIEILSFQAKPGRDHSAVLDWSIADLNELDEIYIQRQTGDSNWYSIHSQIIKDRNLSSLKSSFTDKNCLAANAHYRLMIKTGGGKTEYSNITSVKWVTEELQLYPNPATGFLFIRAKLLANTVTCVNAAGYQVVLPLQNAGAGLYKLNIEKLSRGTWCIGVNNIWHLFQKR